MNMTLVYALIMVLAGVGIPIMAVLNAGLGSRLQSPAAAAAILFAVGFIISIAVFLISNPPVLPKTLPSAHYFSGGLFVAFYVLAVTAISPRIGVGNAVFFVLLGQIISATIIDHFGLLGGIKINISFSRLVGLTLMTIGVLLARKSS